MQQSRNKPWLRNYTGFRLITAPVVLGRAMAASRTVTVTVPAVPIAVGMRDAAHTSADV